MSRSTSAALLSGLVFPGLGHLYLKHYRRGVLLLLAAVAAFSVVVTITVRQALSIVEGINRGDIPVDAAAISEMLENPPDGGASSVSTVFTVVLIACWLFGVIDAYRLGARPEEPP